VDYFPIFAQKIGAKLAEKEDIRYLAGSLNLNSKILLF